MSNPVKRILKLIILSIFISCNGYSQPIDLKFRHLTSKEGLQNSTIECICQDYKGFLWFGTEEGLHKFDGYEFTIYSTVPNDTNCIRGNHIKDILEDDDKNIWIGPINGLDLYNQSSNSFKHFPLRQEFPDRNDSSKFYVNYRYHNFMLKILQAHNGTIYCLINEGILCKINKEKGYLEYVYKKNAPVRIIPNFAIDHYDNLWLLGKDEGVFKIDNKTGKITNYMHKDNDPESLTTNYFEQITVDHNNGIWLASHISGVDKIEDKSSNYSFTMKLVGNDISLGQLGIKQSDNSYSTPGWITVTYDLSTFSNLPGVIPASGDWGMTIWTAEAIDFSGFYIDNIRFEKK